MSESYNQGGQVCYPTMQQQRPNDQPPYGQQPNYPPLYNEQYQQSHYPSGSKYNQPSYPPQQHYQQQYQQPIGENASYYNEAPLEDREGHAMNSSSPESEKGLGSTIAGGAAGGYISHQMGGGKLATAGGAVLGAVGMNMATHAMKPKPSPAPISSPNYAPAPAYGYAPTPGTTTTTTTITTNDAGHGGLGSLGGLRGGLGGGLVGHGLLAQRAHGRLANRATRHGLLL
ncbi:hypothetical protein ASPWEDRAFT_471549 [Aspergillus wentii DTO 134E9]|uniref:Glycine zipper 2TM domain-containing protein n=1 Tax=Aspergillus wentii DTO 134E9 TaxID=1073089 RepID=A0A1L9RSS7_ASPWE|nr:uncharacterized protein ASPWEDRAFT_471549 [Aspergillus wentii DTO 134E9]OJJ37898.1 hypothetical protein ASPWEDRAFT_471549 [Aspergillus wentii DTO 134E9]